VEIDERLDADEPATSNDMQNLLTQARSLLMLQENEEFRQKYQAVLQHEPAVVMEHAGVMKLLRSWPEAAGDGTVQNRLR
jgi:hypothetical protein